MDLRLFLTVFGTVLLAEMGDKTQLATMLYASSGAHPKLTVFLGAALALVLASAIGVAAGAAMSAIVPPQLLNRLAGVAFVLVGVWTFVRA